MAGKWIQGANERMKKKGTEGSLTRIAERHGYSSPLGFAKHVMADKKDFPAKTVKKANFAVNANK
jgi:hypothetical protein